MRFRTLGDIAVTSLALLLLGGCARDPRTAAKEAPLLSDGQRKVAPDFALKDSDGRTVRLSDYRGKVVLLNFWATWCAPCRIEIPWFIEMEQQNKAQGFAVIGIAMDDDGWKVVKPFLRELGINYRTLMGNDMTAALYGGVDSLPTSFLIDRDGRIAAVHVGLVSKSEYDNQVEQLLRAPQASASLTPVPAAAAASSRAK